MTFEPDKPKTIYLATFALITFIALWQILAESADIEPMESTYSLNVANTTYVYPISRLSSVDYGQLIDLNFTFHILGGNCNESNPVVVILVHTSPGNHKKREIIRNTWGGKNKGVVLIFFVGSVDSEGIQKSIEEESNKYNDIVQGSFKDSYRNLTYKHVMILKYVVYHCTVAKYILKTDDDVFVNTKQLINFLNNDLSPFGGNKMLFCIPRKGSLVERSYRSKWRVSFDEYRGKYYPIYCPGWTIMYSPDVVFNLYQNAQNSPYFWIDDVHITGTLAEKSHLKHTNVGSLAISKNDLRNVVEYNYNMTKPFLYGRANLSEKQILALWNLVKNSFAVDYLLKRQSAKF